MPFFKGCKFQEFHDFLKIRGNYFHENQIITVQDGKRNKFAKIKSVKLIFRQIRKIYSPQKRCPMVRKKVLGCKLIFK